MAALMWQVDAISGRFSDKLAVGNRFPPQNNQSLLNLIICTCCFGLTAISLGLLIGHGDNIDICFKKQTSAQYKQMAEVQQAIRQRNIRVVPKAWLKALDIVNVGLSHQIEAHPKHHFKLFYPATDSQ